jgi:hypothetical protein
LWQGQDSNLYRQCRRFTVGSPSPRGSRPIPTWSRTSLVTRTNDRSAASAVPWRPRRLCPGPRGLASGGGKSEGNPGRQFQPYFLPGFVSPTIVPIQLTAARIDDASRPARASRNHDTRRLHAIAPGLVGQTIERAGRLQAGCSSSWSTPGLGRLNADSCQGGAQRSALPSLSMEPGCPQRACRS